MKRIILFLFIISARYLLAECCCCCGDGEDQTPDLGGGQTGECVHMSPEECEGIKSNLRSTVANARSDLSLFESEVVSKLQALLESLVNNVVTEINMASMYLNYLTSTNSALQSSIRDSISSLDSTINTLNSIRNSYSFGNSYLSVSNLTSGQTQVLQIPQNPKNALGTAIQKIEGAKESLNLPLSLSSQESALISQALSSMDIAVTALDSAVTSLTEIQVASETTFNNVTEEINSIEAYALEINCTACTSGGGDGGSGGGTIDLTPLVLAINNLKESMIDQFTQLRELIEKFYTDYSSASGWHVTSKPTYSLYSSSDNWFKRMEMLLFAASGLSIDEEEVEDPDTSEITKFKDSVDDNIQENSDALKEHFSEDGKFMNIFNKLTEIFEKFEYLGNGSSDINAPFFHENVMIGNLDFGNISLPASVSASITHFFTIVRYAFQALYMVFFAFVLFYMIIWTYREGQEVFVSALKVYASLFGGGS